jgi:hypothetical protein
VVGLSSEVRNGPMGSSRVRQERYCLRRRASKTGFSQPLADTPVALTVPILLLLETRETCCSGSTVFVLFLPELILSSAHLYLLQYFF